MDLDAFAAAVTETLGPDRVLADEAALAAYRTSASGHSRTVPLALRPGRTEHVQAVLRAAATHRVPVYPVSRGRNWGLGSRLPVMDGGVVVDLSAMDRIIDIDHTFGTATLEPGVTQGQLARALAEAGSPFFLDVTGSGAETSVVGNTLERGVAYNTTRADTLIALTVVLADGTVVETGFGHYGSSRVGTLFSHGIGPDLRELFVQSNLGVVTRATVALLRRPEALSTLILSVRDEAALPGLFDALRELRQEGTLESVVHVGNRRRSEITLTPLVQRELPGLGLPATRAEASAIVDGQLRGPWSAIGAIMGSVGHVAAARRRVKAVLGPFGRLRFMTPRLRRTAGSVAAALRMRRTQAFLAGIEPLMGLTEGIPTDAALHSTWWPAGGDEPTPHDPDTGEGGIVFAAPIVPLDGEAVRAMLAATAEVGAAHGFSPAITLNLMNGRTLEGVVSIDFRRTDSDDVRRAHACIRALNARYRDDGFTPYRIDIGNMDLMIDGADPFWQVVTRLKATLDPAGILAPGRYAPLPQARHGRKA